jgi:hypothetical protein
MASDADLFRRQNIGGQKAIAVLDLDRAQVRVGFGAAFCEFFDGVGVTNEIATFHVRLLPAVLKALQGEYPYLVLSIDPSSLPEFLPEFVSVLQGIEAKAKAEGLLAG